MERGVYGTISWLEINLMGFDSTVRIYCLLRVV